MRDYIPIEGDHIVAINRVTGRVLEIGMPCKVDYVPADGYVIQCTDQNGRGRIFNCSTFDLVRVYWAIERIDHADAL